MVNIVLFNAGTKPIKRGVSSCTFRSCVKLSVDGGEPAKLILKSPSVLRLVSSPSNDQLALNSCTKPIRPVVVSAFE